MALKPRFAVCFECRKHIIVGFHGIVRNEMMEYGTFHRGCYETYMTREAKWREAAFQAEQKKLHAGGQRSPYYARTAAPV
jgi:hypothetical protein